MSSLRLGSKGGPADMPLSEPIIGANWRANICQILAAVTKNSGLSPHSPLANHSVAEQRCAMRTLGKKHDDPRGALKIEAPEDDRANQDGDMNFRARRYPSETQNREDEAGDAEKQRDA